MDETERRILQSYRRVAVVGISDDPLRASYGVAEYLQASGYTVIPVNPRLREWCGIACWPDLASAPGPVEVVDVFRRSDQVRPIVEEAIRIGARALWLQEGVVDETAARLAREAGLDVVMDRCMLKAHRELTHA